MSTSRNWETSLRRSHWIDNWRISRSLSGGRGQEKEPERSWVQWDYLYMQPSPRRLRNLLWWNVNFKIMLLFLKNINKEAEMSWLQQCTLRFCFGRYGLIPQLLRVMRDRLSTFLQEDSSEGVPFLMFSPFLWAQAITGQLECPRLRQCWRAHSYFRAPQGLAESIHHSPASSSHPVLLPSLSMSVDPRMISTKFPACQALSQCLLLRDRGIT